MFVSSALVIGTLTEGKGDVGEGLYFLKWALVGPYYRALRPLASPPTTPKGPYVSLLLFWLSLFLPLLFVRCSIRVIMMIVVNRIFVFILAVIVISTCTLIIILTVCLRYYSPLSLLSSLLLLPPQLSPSSLYARL